MGNLQVELPALQLLICRLILFLKPTTLSLTVFQCTFLYGHTYYILNNISIFLLVTWERSSHLILLDMTKVLPLFTYKKQILERLSVHLNNLLSCIKLLVSVLNLALDNKQSKFFDCFWAKIMLLFLNTFFRWSDCISLNFLRIF